MIRSLIMPKITFTQSELTAEWTGEHDSILEFAEAHGLDLNFGCRQGNCTACQQKIISGKVSYPNGHSGVPEEGNELLCCSVPDGDLEIEA